MTQLEFVNDSAARDRPTWDVAPSFVCDFDYAERHPEDLTSRWCRGGEYEPWILVHPREVL
jgi:hypothetical protein